MRAKTSGRSGFNIMKYLVNARKKTFSVNGRLFRSYIMCQFTYRTAGIPDASCYELDMAAPEGVTGAPVIIDFHIFA